MSAAQDTAWRAETVSPHAKDALFAHVRSTRQELRDNTRAVRNLGFIVGASGTVVGLAGILCAAVAFPLKTETVRWQTVNESTGWIGQAVDTSDAPKRFNEAVRRQYLAQLVEACEGYEPDTLDITFHRCTAMMTPHVQEVYAERVGPRNVKSSQAKVARKGIVRVEPEMRFQDRPQPKKDAFSYVVRFTRTTFLSGNPVQREAWVAEVTFEWRPDIKRAGGDQITNPGGMVVLSYSAEPETR
jgi:type IV secretory pathway component VirB8